MRRMKRDDEGSVLVLVTVGMTALLLMAAFALDIGQLCNSPRDGHRTVLMPKRLPWPSTVPTGWI